MTDRAFRFLADAGDIGRLDRRLQYSPQPAVYKHLGRWVVDFGSRMYARDTWLEAITTAIYLHAKASP